MKWKACFLKMMLFMMSAVPVYAQQRMLIKEAHLLISDHVTTNIILPYPIKSVDRGSPFILVQQAAGAENVLQVRAADTAMRRTNLTVITSGGYLFAFIVEYSSDAPLQPVDLSQDDAVSIENLDDEVYLKTIADAVAARKPMLHKKAKNLDMLLDITGLYVKGNYFFIQLSVENRSQIDYDLAQLRFFVKDKRVAKRTATQELELNPSVFSGWTDHLPARTKAVLVAVIPKFSLQEGKELQVQLVEKDAGRDVEVRFDNKWIRKAKMLEDKN